MVNEKIKKILVDQDILQFLRGVYFGNFADPLLAASSRAYRDMNRTIRFYGVADEVRWNLRNQVNQVLREQVAWLTPQNIRSASDFDGWHQEVCSQIKRIYVAQGITLTYGQAQKWVNMTIKYLYMLEVNDFAGIFQYLHVPLDNYIFDIAHDALGIARPKQAWSRWDSYQDQYLQYQYLLRAKLGSQAPLRWEFRNWRTPEKWKLRGVFGTRIPV